MDVTVWLRYLFGNAGAIRQVATDRSAIWIGMVLVVLTSVARNYDQIYIGENTFRWFFGGLIFSFLSGTFVYMLVYGNLARREMAGTHGENKPPYWSAWRSFMGLFWMTAPIAWLYAIPVERFLDPVAAAKGNVTLLAIVSFWRVMLTARVIQVLTDARFVKALAWVLLAASIEIVVVTFFGKSFAQAIMRGMGGMRNSPAEDIIFAAANTAMSCAFYAALILLPLVVLWRTRNWCSPFPKLAHASRPLLTLIVAALFWAGVAIVPQRQVANSVAVEQLVREKKFRKALDYLASHAPGDFAPARELPPKAFEHGFFKELPDSLAVVQPTDPLWVRQHLTSKMDDLYYHFTPRDRRREQVEPTQLRFFFSPLKADVLVKVLENLERFPDGRGWLKTNTAFVAGMMYAVEEGKHLRRYSTSTDQAAEEAVWIADSNRLHTLLRPYHTPASTNSPPP